MVKLLVAIVITCISGTLAKPPSKIKGGVLANEGEFPWQVSLRRNGKHFCGASIIDAKHILTAAHCVVTKNLRSGTGITILMGTNIAVQWSPKTYGVKRLHVHEKYIGKAPYRYDIAVIALDTPIEFNALQKPIALPGKDILVGDRVTVSGWGVTEYPHVRSSSPSKLIKMEKKIVSNTHCKSRHGIEIHPEHLCAYARHGQGICSGDSGSGLLYNDRIVGIASWVRPCGVGYPDVYTRVYSYKAWIEGKITADK